MHENNAVKAIVKFQNLQAACVGSAKGALGEWDSTEENYIKAWERLRSIYEDDYMQVQSYMQMSADLPQLNGSSSKIIRDTINIVQKHLHGLKRYEQLGDRHPYIIYTVISRMDTDTYRRRNLANINAEQADGEANNEIRPGKHLPTWTELEQSLESEVTIRVHAERRNGSDSAQAKHSQPQPGYSKNFKKGKGQSVPPCIICNEIHRIFDCETLDDMNLESRLNQVSEHQLCVRCLCKAHEWRCANKRCNDPCPKCLPEKKFHNSKLCPNQIGKARPVMKIADQRRKRKRTDGNRQAPKRRRFSNAREPQNDSKLQSTAQKVGEWSLIAKQRNALSNIKSSNKPR